MSYNYHKKRTTAVELGQITGLDRATVKKYVEINKIDLSNLEDICVFLLSFQHLERGYAEKAKKIVRRCDIRHDPEGRQMSALRNDGGEQAHE